ncbi:helix-turn-helix domain-containing protein [Bradyrhizobium sp. 83012]|uniref:Helix-turn-helix domain-containing protein n=1 Tax=Bradyrhizobium aeschynomenes TaxID=2734909 RepID=A0ABX2C602_9BRAD|nr:helix-turn-helix domain-containing protein [Bradyrhizobium aeschynomenes]NPU63719.1 helix-turn-helix domain-containing protein [Bradyrhizobium aeschynomenes]
MDVASQIDSEDDFIADRTKVRAKWGVAAVPGFGTYPILLMMHQARLGIDVYEMNVLMQLIAHWHAAERAPFPHTKTIANRMGLGIRKIQRCLKSLQEKGYIAKVEKKTRADRVSYDIRPLAVKLDPIAREWLLIRADLREEQQRRLAEIRATSIMPSIREVDFDDIPF